MMTSSIKDVAVIGFELHGTNFAYPSESPIRIGGEPDGKYIIMVHEDGTVSLGMDVELQQFTSASADEHGGFVNDYSITLISRGMSLTAYSHTEISTANMPRFNVPLVLARLLTYPPGARVRPQDILDSIGEK